MSAVIRVPLSSVVLKTTGGGTPERDNPDLWNGGIPWASVKDFKDGIYRLTKTKEQISEKGLKRSASHLIPSGTPIICTRMAVGRIARANVPVAINQDLRALYIREEFDTDYVVWALDAIRHRIENLSIGSTVKGISIEQLLSFEIESPSKPEQTKIAEILSTVDRAIEQTETLIDKQQHLKTGLMQDLLTRGIDPHGNLRSEETHEFKDSPLGRIPVEWEVKPLSSVVDLQVGYAFKSSWFVEEGVKLLRGENVGTGKADWKDTRCLSHEASESHKDYALAPGDMIIGMDRTFTKQGFKVTLLTDDDVPCLLVQRVGRFVPMTVPKKFMQLLIQSPAYQRELLIQQKGMDIPHLSKSEILTPSVPVPREQTEMDAIASEVAKMNATLSSTRHSLPKLRALKTAMMQDLLTGRKRVTDLLDNTEVPA
jgi:type I restriction enzyme S subunit